MSKFIIHSQIKLARKSQQSIKTKLYQKWCLKNCWYSPPPFFTPRTLRSTFWLLLENEHKIVEDMLGIFGSIYVYGRNSIYCLHLTNGSKRKPMNIEMIDIKMSAWKCLFRCVWTICIRITEWLTKWMTGRRLYSCYQSHQIKSNKKIIMCAAMCYAQWARDQTKWYFNWWVCKVSSNWLSFYVSLSIFNIHAFASYAYQHFMIWKSFVMETHAYTHTHIYKMRSFVYNLFRAHFKMAKHFAFH